VFTLHDKVLKSTSFWAEAVLKPGSHSSSLELIDYKNVSAVDQLVVKLFQECQRFVDHAEAEKLEAAVQLQRKKDMSNLVSPPPGLENCNVLSSLSSSKAISSIISPHPTATMRVHNNLQDVLVASVDVDEAEEKENSSARIVLKRKNQPVLASVDAGGIILFCHGEKKSYHGHVFIITSGDAEGGGSSRGAS
jgi:hypothetical protein